METRRAPGSHVHVHLSDIYCVPFVAGLVLCVGGTMKKVIKGSQPQGIQSLTEKRTQIVFLSTYCVPSTELAALRIALPLLFLPNLYNKDHHC